MKTVIITGSQGFIGGYLCREFLAAGYMVVGYDDYSKYGRVRRDYDNHQNFCFNEFDLSSDFPSFESWNPDYIILGAALIGGIACFHKYTFDLIMQNELIMADCYQSILKCDKKKLKRVITISSSMVYEGADKENEKLYRDFCGDIYKTNIWPTDEDHIKELPPPVSTYGGQKLMTEYWAKGAWEQYKIPYTIVRPFNCVGLGEEASKFDAEVMSGNVRLMMSHVLPDLMNKCLKGQDPLHILGDGSQVRCYTHGKDIARGIRLAAESEAGLNNDFNISVERPTTVLELARMVWEKVNGDKPFNYVSDEPFEHDVQRRQPNVDKAAALLGFEAKISLEDTIDELYNHMKKEMELEHSSGK